MTRLLLLLLILANPATATLNIVVSIKPIHSIVSNITQGVSNPLLLLDSNQSAHHFNLKPSQLSLIENANLVVAIHPQMEEGLNKALSNLAPEKIFYISSYEEHEEHEEHEE
ncbi:zinc ABC transporter substrate-binding protein, partial [Candidatus Thioglobus sp.]|uniref:metal ABC transporter solute-binding protein, Zn/Mn family n=1 Tax=Candidatus Thioglobus sp. TaxID=2026721 RepID=UPI002610BE40